MDDNVARNLDRDFMEDPSLSTRIVGSGSDRREGAEMGNPVQRSEVPKVTLTSGQTTALLSHLLAQAATSANPGVPFMTPAPIANAFAQHGIDLSATVPTSGPVLKTVEKPVLELIVGDTPGDPKSIPKNFGSLADTGSSSSDMQEVDKQPQRTDPTAREAQREAYIKKQLEDLEKTLRSEKEPEPETEPRVGQPKARSARREHARAIAINDQVENPKRSKFKRNPEPRVPAERNVPTAWMPPRLRRSPFSEGVLSDPLPVHYKPISIEYDGKEDPAIHMSRFEGFLTLHQYSDGVKCRIFSTTLVGAAQQWFQMLEESSIYCFEDLYTVFMQHFASSRKAVKNPMALMDLEQGQTETLRDYVTRFNTISLEIPDVDPKFKGCAFTRGLRPGPLWESININPPADYEELLARIPGYIQLEEAKAIRKAEKEKTRPKKENESGRDRFPPRGPPPRIPYREEYRGYPLVSQTQSQGQDVSPKLPGHQRDPPRGPPPAERDYIPLNRTVTAIFHSLKNEPFFRLPASNRGPQLGEAPGQNLCLFHNRYGHETEKCRHLKDVIEDLARGGVIPGFVRKDAPNPNGQKQVFYLNDAGNQLIRVNPEGQNRAPPPPPPYAGREVHMIISGEVDGNSNRSRKRVIESLRTGYHQVMSMSLEEEDEIEISFGPKDKRDLVTPHADALVCTADIANCMVHRLFVDTGSAVNILYWDCLQAMGIRAELKPPEGPLYGFSGEAVLPMGILDLPLSLGSPALRKTRMVRFMVMELSNTAYNGILGRPALASFKAVVSMVYLKMKFPVGNGKIGEVYGNQLSSKECYVKAMTGRGNLARTEGVENEESGKRQKRKDLGTHNRAELLLLAEASQEVDRSPLVTTADRCEEIELFSDRVGFTTKIGADLDPEIREGVVACLRRHANIFAFSTADLKGIDRKIAEHKLNENPEVKPVKQRVRQFNEEKNNAIKEQVAELLKAGHIREVKYPIWISNAVMVEKKDKKWRMCIDFRDLNAACPKDHYPLPRIDQLVDATSGCQLLSMMDAFQGYHQIKMCEEDVPKTAFAVCCGVYGYVSMPFGLKNAGATYQRMMDQIFKDQIGRNMAVYVDDMLVKSAVAATHVADLEETFCVIEKFGLMLNPAKCTFGVRSGRFLGYEVTPRGIEVNQEKVKAILEMEAPRNIKEVQKLNGRITALSRFISRSADKSLPFCRILRNGCKFQWDTTSQKAFENLKSYLAELPILTKPVPGEDLYLYLSVGEESLGTVLVREEGERQWPIYFVSRIIQGSELNYSEIEKASLAVMVTARKLRPYFLSHKIIVRTMLPFRQTLGRPDLSGRMVKWAVELGEFEIEFEPRKAIKAQALADFIQETTRVPELTAWIASVDGSVTKEGYGIGIHIQSPRGEVFQHAIKLDFKVSNNEAEYEATVRSMEMLAKHGAEKVILRSDSQLVAQQVLGNYEIREERMNEYVDKIKALASCFASFQVEQVPRGENKRADFLAKLASSVGEEWNGRVILTREEKGEQVATTLAVMAIENRDLDWRTPIIHFLKTGQRLPNGTPARTPYGRFCLIKENLYKKSFTLPLLKCIAGEEAIFALKEVHEGCCGAHSGYKDLAKKIIRAGFYWPTLKESARIYVQKCQKCQRNAPRILVPAEGLGIMFSAYPFDKWGIDIVGKLPTAPGGKVFLIVAIDYFSKWVEAEAVVKIDEVTIERFIWRNICCRYGSPRILISDNGTQFTGDRVRDFCERMDIEQRFVSVAHPQANGQVELANRTICDGIQKRLEKSKGKWAEELDSVLWAHRTSPKTATGETPFSLVYGSEAVIPAEARLESFRVEAYDEEKNDNLRREDLDLVDIERETAFLKAAKYKSQVKASYDKRVRTRKFHKGELVLKRADALRQVGKFEPTWEGPFAVTEVLGGGAYLLAEMDGRPLTRAWNANHLKKYYV